MQQLATKNTATQHYCATHPAYTHRNITPPSRAYARLLHAHKTHTAAPLLLTGTRPRSSRAFLPSSGSKRLHLPARISTPHGRWLGHRTAELAVSGTRLDVPLLELLRWHCLLRLLLAPRLVGTVSDGLHLHSSSAATVARCRAKMHKPSSSKRAALGVWPRWKAAKK